MEKPERLRFETLGKPPMLKRDLTKDYYNYPRWIDEEKSHRSEIEFRNEKEGEVHAGHCWQYYWNRVNEVLANGPVGYIGDYLDRYFEKHSAPINILSLGSGHCGHELELARRLKGKIHVVCTDSNDKLFKQARTVAQEDGLSMDFRLEDLNSITIEPDRYQMIFAHAVLHQIINLKHLFETIALGLTHDGLFHLVDVVGGNRQLIWRENEAFANALLDRIPTRITGGIRLRFMSRDDGFEDSRQEGIIPELLNSFYPEYEYAHGAFMRFICTNSDLAPHFDPSDPEARRYLDFLIDCDVAAVKHNVLRPLEIWGVYKPRPYFSRKNTHLPAAKRESNLISRFKRIIGTASKFRSDVELSSDCLIRASEQRLQIPLDRLFAGLPLAHLSELLKNGEEPLDHQKVPIERFLQFFNVHGKSILEIGADDAGLLLQLARKGMHRGLGINNWYWDHKKIKTVKVTDQIVLSYGDIRSLPLEDGDFDLIFSVAAFEHIHKLDVALEEMYRLLKPGGLVYSHFGPLWSSGIGHHLWFERKGQWHRFTDEKSTSPILKSYEHLLFDREEMKMKLRNHWEPEDVNRIIYELYDNPHINRYMYSDYIRMFDESLFKVVHLQNMGKIQVDPAVHEQLCMKFGSENDFSCATLEVVLEKL